MASFDVLVDGKTYKMFFDRASIRQFEEIGGKLTDMREKMYSTADKLMYVGMRKFHPQISPAEAFEISDKAIAEYGIESVYESLIGPFMEVFTQAGSNSTPGKSFIVGKSPSKA